MRSHLIKPTALPKHAPPRALPASASTCAWQAAHRALPPAGHTHAAAPSAVGRRGPRGKQGKPAPLRRSREALRGQDELGESSFLSAQHAGGRSSALVDRKRCAQHTLPGSGNIDDGGSAGHDLSPAVEGRPVVGPLCSPVHDQHHPTMPCGIRMRLPSRRLPVPAPRR